MNNRSLTVIISVFICASPLLASAHSLTCPTLTVNMSIGATDATTGGQVSELQTLLSSYYASNPPANLQPLPTTGFFGPITESWVIQFQRDHDLPQTGYVGPLTRAAIAGACTTTGGGSSTLSASPTSGAGPLAVTFTAVSNSAGILFSFWFGDGTSQSVSSSCVNGNSCTLTASHTYTTAGTYTAQLFSSTKASVGSVVIVVSGGAQPNISFTATPTSGAAPLTVAFTVSTPACISGQPLSPLDFGDGNSQNVPCDTSTTLSHTYQSAGIYLVQLFSGQYCRQTQCPTLGTVTITVTGTAAGTSGVYLAQSVPFISAGSTASCTLNGTTIADGSSGTFYSDAAVAYGDSCTNYAQVRTCTNGVLSGSSAYQYSACAVGNPNACSFNGQAVASGASVTAYQSASVPFGQTCSSQSRMCSNGNLSGSYQYPSCTVQAASSCTFNGQSVPNGQSVTAYQSSTVPAGSQCVSAQLTCSNGTLSNVQNYPYASCTVASYPVMPNPPQTQVINSYDAYSPEPIDWNGGIRLYFGGWYTAADSPNDSIFVADCPSSGAPCSNVRKVIDPVATGWNQLNDPSIILHPATASSPAYYIMYMTCDTSPSPASNGICYSTSWANDGINWSTPILLTSSYWLPSATWKNDHVELWANEISPGRVVMFNLGSSGVVLGNPTVVQYDNTSAVPPLYANVNVDWRPSIGMYQILAERSVGGTASSPSVIDYLSSADGVNWHLQYPAVISAQPGQFRVGTPGQNPDTAAFVYFGVTALTDSEGFSIDFSQWSPPSPTGI